MEILCLTVGVNWSCDQHVAKSHGVLGRESHMELLSLPGETQPSMEDKHKAQGVPAAAFGLNLLLHFSQNLHLQPDLQ